jgi:hypothetical protein
MSGSSGSYTPPPPRLDAFVGVTDADGRVMWAFDEPFPAPPVVTATVHAATGFYSLQVAQVGAESCLISVVESAAVTLLGIGVLAVGAPAVGVTVNATATPAPIDG